MGAEYRVKDNGKKKQYDSEVNNEGKNTEDRGGGQKLRMRAKEGGRKERKKK